ncbi:MAG: amidohydrolase family protein [Solobacterium sp.]|nr:amidohydrolase family protein [Solobacterium sp.]
MKKAILCGKLFTAANDKVQKNMVIFIEDGKITDVKTAKKADTADCEVIDLSDKFVMPGLIDGHMHSIYSGEAAVVSKTAAENTINGMLNLEKDLMAGFTTIRDEGSFDFEDVALKKAIDAGRIKGPRMITSGKPITATGGHADSRYPLAIDAGDYGAFVISGADQARDAARKVFKYGADQIKLMGTGGVMSMGDEPGAPELTFDELKAAADIANDRGRNSSIHCHGAKGMKNAMKAGVRTIEHGMLMDDEAIDMMAETGTYLIPTIVAAKAIVDNGVAAGIHPENVAKAAFCVANHYTNLMKCYKKGVKICWGTDAGTPFNFHGTQTVEFKYMADAGLPVGYILQAVTRVNAEMLMMEDKIGTVEAGKFADIVAVDGDPFKDIETMRHVSFVMKGGEVFKQ